MIAMILIQLVTFGNLKEYWFADSGGRRLENCIFRSYPVAALGWEELLLESLFYTIRLAFTTNSSINLL